MEVAKLVIGIACLLLRLLPGTPQTNNFRAVHAAHPREPGDGLALAPAAGHLGPIAGPLVIGRLLAGSDHVAIDDPGRVRSQLAGQGGDGRLVEQRHPLVHLA